jgi:hypothetical protein
MLHDGSWLQLAGSSCFEVFGSEEEFSSRFSLFDTTSLPLGSLI